MNNKLTDRKKFITDFYTLLLLHKQPDAASYWVSLHTNSDFDLFNRVFFYHCLSEEYIVAAALWLEQLMIDTLKEQEYGITLQDQHQNADGYTPPKTGFVFNGIMNDVNIPFKVFQYLANNSEIKAISTICTEHISFLQKYQK